MDVHALDYFKEYSDKNPQAKFHKVIFLQEERNIEWDQLKKMVPLMNKGWYELAKLPKEDRLEFIRDYWISKLPYHPKAQTFIYSFFQSLDDIGIVIFQSQFNDPFEVNLIYSIENNGGFFRGCPGASENAVVDLQQKFSEFILPIDFIAFLKIHDGFAKLNDTGIIKSQEMYSCYREFQSRFTPEEPLFTMKGDLVNPKLLIPFYKSFGMPFYQCFCDVWYPDQEMGNVYYSGTANAISDYKSEDPACESMAFPSFFDWLMFYLERID